MDWHWSLMNSDSLKGTFIWVLIYNTYCFRSGLKQLLSWSIVMISVIHWTAQWLQHTWLADITGVASLVDCVSEFLCLRPSPPQSQSPQNLKPQASLSLFLFLCLFPSISLALSFSLHLRLSLSSFFIPSSSIWKESLLCPAAVICSQGCSYGQE